MRVIYNGEIIETGQRIIDDRAVIDDKNYKVFDWRRINETHDKLKEDMLIPVKPDV